MREFFEFIEGLGESSETQVWFFGLFLWLSAIAIPAPAILAIWKILDLATYLGAW